MNHIDAEKPITGVANASDYAQLISDSYDAIDLDLIEHQKECEACQNEEACEWIEYGEQGTLLIGSWKEKNGLFEPDRDGEFSAIVGEQYVQFVWSRHTKKCGICSPCFPGQADLNSDGDFHAYYMPQ